MAHVHDKRNPECLAIFAGLSDYIDGELAAEECRRVEEHLADCPQCIEFLRSLKTSVAASKSYEPATKPPPLPEALRKKLLAAWSAAVGGPPSSQT